MEHLTLLRNIANKSKFKRARHASIVLKGGAIISYAHNGNFTHAEVRALRKLWPNKRRGTIVVNLRFTAASKVGNSAPCNACKVYMEKAGVKKVIYTNSSGEFEEMKL